MAFTLTSPAFKDGDEIPSRFTCDGDNLSPELTWRGAPSQAKASLLIVDDPDAPSGTFTHWILTDIPGTESALAEGRHRIGIAGINGFSKPGYGGPCPPRGHGVHRYFFRLYALRDLMRLKDGITRQAVDKLLPDLSLGHAELMGRYARR